MYIHTLLSSLLPPVPRPRLQTHTHQFTALNTSPLQIGGAMYYDSCIPNAKCSESDATPVAWRCAGSDDICTVYRTCYIISTCLTFLPKVWKLVHMSTSWPQHNTSHLMYVAACGVRTNTLPWEIWGLITYCGCTYVIIAQSVHGVVQSEGSKHIDIVQCTKHPTQSCWILWQESATWICNSRGQQLPN